MNFSLPRRIIASMVPPAFGVETMRHRTQPLSVGEVITSLRDTAQSQIASCRTTLQNSTSATYLREHHLAASAFAALPPSLAWLLDKRASTFGIGLFARSARLKPVAALLGPIMARGLTLGLIGGTLDLGARKIADEANVPIIAANTQSCDKALSIAIFLPAFTLFARSVAVSQILKSRVASGKISQSTADHLNAASTLFAHNLGVLLSNLVLTHLDGKNSVLQDARGHSENFRDVTTDGVLDMKKIAVSMLVRAMVASTNSTAQIGFKESCDVSGLSLGVVSFFALLRGSITLGGQNVRLNFLRGDRLTLESQGTDNPHYLDHPHPHPHPLGVSR